MDASSPLPTGSPSSEQGRDGDADKPRLTEEQKRQNHITSGMFSLLIILTRAKLTSHPEQKRRQGIRHGFDKLCEVVPGLEGQGRSEGHVLNETTRQLLDAIDERKRLVAEIERRGGAVPDHLKGSVRLYSPLLHVVASC